MTTALDAPTARYSWPRAAILFGLGCVFSFTAFRDAVSGLSILWWDSVEYGHGALVPPIIAYAIWLDRHRLASFEPRLWLPGLVAVGGCTALWLLSHKLAVAVGEQTALMLVLPALSLVFLGPRITWAMGFVFGFPFLATPLWYLVNPFLQEGTAWATTALVREFGIPMFREGNYLTIAYGKFHVAEMCSGLRYLLAGLSLAAVFAFLNIRSVRLSLLMLALAFVVAVVSNWIRVTGIVVLGHMTKMQHPMIEDHLVFGWVLFAVSMIPLLFIGHRLGAMADAAHTDDAAAGVKAHRGGAGHGGPSSLMLAGTVIASAAMIWTGPLLYRPLDSQVVERISRAFDKEMAEFEVVGWRRIPNPDGTWAPRLSGANGQIVQAFERDGRRVELSITILAQQSQGAEVINDVNRPFNTELFKYSPGQRMGVVQELTDGVKAMESWVIRLERQADADHRFIWSFYRVAGQYSLAELPTKLLQLRELLGATPVAFELDVSVQLDGSIEEARSRMQSFLTEVLPVLTPRLRRIENWQRNAVQMSGKQGVRRGVRGIG